MSLFGFFFKKPQTNNEPTSQSKERASQIEEQAVSYTEQIEVFKSLGYVFAEGVTKEMILSDVYEMTWEDETETHIEKNAFSVLYYFYGWRNSEVPNYNYSDKCIWFDLEFFDPNSQYKWFMERMGIITGGEIEFVDIELSTDNANCEWISFKVNGNSKKWKLEKQGCIADSFVQRFAYLPIELNIKGKYTYFDNGGQQWVIDYATEKEQKEFNKKTGLNREWLGEGNHFNEPKE